MHTYNTQNDKCVLYVCLWYDIHTMIVKKYSKINKSTTSRKDSFLNNLITSYGDNYLSIPIHNNDNEPFVLFNNPIILLENKFEKLVQQAIKLRDVSLTEYIASGYITSEINSSLRAEGVHSSRKLVDQILRAKSNGDKVGNNEINKMVSNYYECLIFILGRKEINTRNLYTLYSMLTTDLDELIEDNFMYRQDVVTIGEDVGEAPKQIEASIKELMSFINSDIFEDRIQTKAIIAHYAFENIHPYYDYNGRMGRLLHLWILINKSKDEFWKLIFLSESIYAYKTKLDSTFRHITKAKKNKANIDITYFVGRLYEIFIDHTQAYIKMKSLVSQIKKTPSRRLRLFIIDILTTCGEDHKWYDITMFKKRYPDYSKTVYDRMLTEIKSSNLFDIQTGRPIRFKLKTK